MHIDNVRDVQMSLVLQALLFSCSIINLGVALEKKTSIADPRFNAISIYLNK